MTRAVPAGIVHRMPESLRISGKDLGQLALAEACPRCFWIQRRAPKGVPYQIFPGIFSSIDSYTKRVVHGWFDRHGGPPPWLAPLGPIARYREPPHHTKFRHFDEARAVLLTGAPDGVFERPDGSLVIVDYKTARHTASQDGLFPMYRVQLNAYARIAERTGYGAVTGLALIYTDPLTEDAHAGDAAHRNGGFALDFEAKVVPVPLEPDALDPLFDRLREILDRPAPPPARAGCRDCERLDGIVSQLAASTAPR